MPVKSFMGMAPNLPQALGSAHDCFCGAVRFLWNQRSPHAILGKHGRRTLKKTSEVRSLVPQEVRRRANHKSEVVFCEKATGVAQFRAELSAYESFNVERIAGLLAMHCLVRGRDPEDFAVLVPAERALVERLVSRARDLLEEGRAIPGPAALSRRQKEVLQSVLRNRANKEIASQLNITVRTVKFHISSLLCKFGVDNRIELAGRAAGLLRVNFPGGADAASPADTHEPLERELLRVDQRPGFARVAGRALPA